MEPLNISVDLGGTLFDRSRKIELGRNYIYPFFPGAEGAIRGWARSVPGVLDYKVSIISKIDMGQEMRVGLSLYHSNLVPYAIDARDVHFCYKREQKGAIARLVTHSDIHIDDRVDCINSTCSEGIKHNILFIGGHDDRENVKLFEKAAETVIIAHNWDEVWEIVYNLSL